MNMVTALDTFKMWPFKKKIWKEVDRKLLRQQRDCSNFGGELFNVYALYYIDINSGKTKVEEQWQLAV